MPAFNNAVPMLPKRYDLRDVVDHVDRLLEVLDQAVSQSQGQIYPLTISPDGTGTSAGVPNGAGTAFQAGSFPRPGYVQTADITTYENILTQSTVAACAAANTGYGVKELLAVVSGKLAALEALNSDFVQPGF